MTSRFEDHVSRTIATYDAIAPHYGLTATPALRAWEESMRLFLADGLMLLNPRGILYLNVKIGRGEEFRDVPDQRYPGGDEARHMLRGPRYYAYYQRSELTTYFIGYDVVRQRDVEHPQEVVEAWLRKPRGDGSAGRTPSREHESRTL